MIVRAKNDVWVVFIARIASAFKVEGSLESGGCWSSACVERLSNFFFFNCASSPECLVSLFAYYVH